MKKIALTGDRPSGDLHLGHYVGSLKNRVELQDQYNQFIMIADVQAITDHFECTKKISESILSLARSYFAVGIDFSKSTVYIQSLIKEIPELTMYYLNLVTLARLERNPTVKTELKQKSFSESIPVGFLCYPINQAADITIFRAEFLPVGDDQLPLIEQSNEIVRKFNKLYNTNFLIEAEAIFSHCTRLPGIDGIKKASKSLRNAIFLNDSEDDVEKKVRMMFTDPLHIKASDPGRVEGNVVFTYLDAFHENKEEISELKKHYSSGGLGDTTIKNVLSKSLKKLLEPIREKSNSITDNELKEMLSDGIFRAQKISSENMNSIREIMGINYFKN